MELMKLVDIDVDRNNLPEYIRDICEENKQHILLEMTHQAMMEKDEVKVEFWNLTYDDGMHVYFICVQYRPWDKYNPIHSDYMVVSHDKLKKIMEMIK
jgi:hypothetical protein